MEDLSQEPPTDINPYEVLQLKPTASPDEVRSAYKKLALRNHPDKVTESARESAHIKFQEIAFAYAILSEPRRRQRYDATGNTSESIDTEDGFNWSDFYKARFADSITAEKLHTFKDSYQNSGEEANDVLAAYKVAKGDMDKVFGKVMLSNPLYDEARFRLIIEKGIEAGEVEIYKLFNQEPETKRIKRQRRAAKESTEAMEYAKELGVYDALFPPATAGESANKNGRLEPQSSKRGQKTPKDSGLAGLIQKKQQARASQFLEDLEAKYVGKKGTKRKFEEPPEDLFQKNRHAKRKVPEAEVEVEDESDEEVDDLGTEDSGSDADEEIKPTKSKGKSTKGQKGGKPRPTKVTAAKIPPVKKASVAKAPTRRGPTRKGVKEGTDS